MCMIMGIFLYLGIFSLLNVVEGEADICRLSCESTYPLHTTDKVRELRSCLTGCRISFITQLSSNLLENSEIIPTCKKDCDEGYNDRELQAACHLGCNSQQVRSSLREHEDFASPFELAWHRQLFHPFHHLGRYCSSVYQNAASYIVSSVVNQDGSGSTIIMEVAMAPQQAIAVIPDVEEPKNDEESSGLKKYAQVAYQHGTKWLNCVESRAGIPYWSLVGILFLSLFFMCWVCCSSCDDEPERRNSKKHVFKEAVPLHGDFMEKPPPYFILDANEAGSLPEKAKLLM